MAQHNDRNNNNNNNAHQNQQQHPAAAAKGKRNQQAAQPQRSQAQKEWSTQSDRNAANERSSSINHRPLKETS